MKPGPSQCQHGTNHVNLANLSFRLSEITHGDVTDSETGFVSSLGRRRDSPSSIAKPVRPVEFSLWVAIPFINLFVILAVLLGILYGKAHTSGTSVPTQPHRFHEKHLMRNRPTTAFPEFHRAEYSGKLHSHSYRDTDRANVDTDQSTTMHATTT